MISQSIYVFQMDLILPTEHYYTKYKSISLRSNSFSSEIATHNSENNHYQFILQTVMFDCLLKHVYIHSQIDLVWISFDDEKMKWNEMKFNLVV